MTESEKAGSEFSGSQGEDVFQDPYEEINALVQILNQRQVFRLAFDVCRILPHYTNAVIADIHAHAGPSSAARLASIMELLDKVPAHQCQHIMLTLTEAAKRAGSEAANQPMNPSGLSTLRKVLADERLWDELGPALDELRTFTTDLRQRMDVSP